MRGIKKHCYTPFTTARHLWYTMHCCEGKWNVRLSVPLRMNVSLATSFIDNWVLISAAAEMGLVLESPQPPQFLPYLGVALRSSPSWLRGSMAKSREFRYEGFAIGECRVRIPITSTRTHEQLSRCLRQTRVWQYTMAHRGGIVQRVNASQF